jgi:hypothetical protein
VQTFRARILKAGVNPYVEVPARVTRALAGHARRGRVRVEGRLQPARGRGGAPLIATLVPVANGRQRLYVHGGMRAAAGVAAGDVVRVTLRPVAPDAASVPADLRTALRRAGARGRFDPLPASLRRELVRWVEAAPTADARRQRIGDTVASVLTGFASAPATPRASAARGQTPGPLWACPRCGSEFVNVNQWHSCARHSVEEVLGDTSADVRALFEGLRALVEACGPVKLVAYRDRVAFMVRVRFAAATPRARAVDVSFWLPRRVDSPRLRRVETLTPAVHIHHLRITAADQLDRELAGWIREAYAVGRREHLR